MGKGDATIYNSPTKWLACFSKNTLYKKYFLLGIVNDIPKVLICEPVVTITCVGNEIMSFEKKVVNFEIKQNMDWRKTIGDDILYLITPRNLKIHLVIG